MGTQTDDYAKRMEHAIRTALRELVAEECKKIVEEAKSSLEKRVANIVAAVSLQVFGTVSFERMAHELIIHVKMDKL